MRGTISRRTTFLAVAIFAAMTMAILSGCSGGGQVSDDARMDAKSIIKASNNVLAASDDIEVQSGESVLKITPSDSRFKGFYDDLSAYKGMDGLDTSSCTFEVSVVSVTAATAREDSTQTNYRFSISKAEMKVDGKTVLYDKSKGFRSK